MQSTAAVPAGRHFSYFLAGQGILSLGESMRFVAITMLIYKMTGSGVSAAAGVVFSTLPSIFASPMAGVLGDRAREGRLLILVDIARFLSVPLFLYVNNVIQIYMLLILISTFDVLYNPSKRKYILGSTGRSNALKANSQLTGIGGAAYLAGPLLAGFITDSHGAGPVIIISAVCCLLSGFMTLVSILAGGGSHGAILADFYEKRPSAFLNGIKYCRDMPEISEMLIAAMVIGFCTVSVNLAFYPFAFDVIKVTGKGWSLMITIYYGTNLLAMLMTGYLEKKKGMKDGRVFYGCLTAISVIWFIYAGVRSFALILLLQFIEGAFSSMSSIILDTRLQEITGKQYMARVAGINDVLLSAGKLTGMGSMALIASRCPFIYVFFLCGSMMLVFSVIRQMRPGWTGNGAR